MEKRREGRGEEKKNKRMQKVPYSFSESKTNILLFLTRWNPTVVEGWAT